MRSDFIYPIILFVFGIYAMYRGIYTIKTRNLYWVSPTITGFKNRKHEKEPLLWVVVLTAISTMLFGIFLIVISVMAIKHKLGL